MPYINLSTGCARLWIEDTIVIQRLRSDGKGHIERRRRPRIICVIKLATQGHRMKSLRLTNSPLPTIQCTPTLIDANELSNTGRETSRGAATTFGYTCPTGHQGATGATGPTGCPARDLTPWKEHALKFERGRGGYGGAEKFRSLRGSHVTHR